MYVRPLREIDPPIIPRDRLESFIQDVFHNFSELHAHHRKLLDQLHEIQREEPTIQSITAPLFDAAFNFRHAYMEYVPNYPIAAYRIDDEPFVQIILRRKCSTSRLEFMTNGCSSHSKWPGILMLIDWIWKILPIDLYQGCRYELLLKGILDETPKGIERPFRKSLTWSKPSGKKPNLASSRRNKRFNFGTIMPTLYLSLEKSSCVSS